MAKDFLGIGPGLSKAGWPITLGALFAVYVFWGGTYLGIRFAVQTIPPFLMAGSRFLIAGGIVYLYARLKGAEPPRKRHWRGASVVGALLLVGGNGLVSWAERLVPSGIAALLIATVPLWMILLGLLGKDSRQPGVMVLSGILLGFLGIAVLVFSSGPEGGGISLLGAAALVVAALSWSLGSLYSRKVELPASPLLANGMQMMAGGLLLVAVSGVCGEWPRLAVRDISRPSLLGLGYLILFGSIVAYNAYLWLLKNADPAWVSTYAFVNPVVAVLLGWLLGGERLTTGSILATLIIVAAVVMITVDRHREAQVRRLEPGLDGDSG